MKYYYDNNNNMSLIDPDFDSFIKPFISSSNMRSMMKTDIIENEKDYTFEIDMPGFDKKDIEMNFEKGYLTVSATKQEKNDEQDKKGKYLRRERRYGSCSRTFYIGDIDENAIKASYNNGILNVIIPKEAEKLPEKKTIAIE